MGVPAFFRWLCARNPKILLEARENAESYDALSTNPDIDNLYLDMNGIIHPCAHPEVAGNFYTLVGIPVPITFHDMFVNVFNYIDRIVDLLRPKQIIYMAVDGVAPRAKMNQQRSRRFRAAQESARIHQEKVLLRDYWAMQGQKSEVLDDYIQNHFDSNQITPGTDFMFQLSIAIQYYIYDRLNNHPLFQDLVIIFSDANIPGEGEHKILQFIRDQRCQIGYNPNQRHCIYGADADLIMLALSTHEPWFYVIRETIMANEDKFCSICQEKGHFFTDCPKRTQLVQLDDEIVIEQPRIRTLCVNFQLIQISLLREFLSYEMRDPGSDLDLDRIVDDFVFMCKLVGNDFLPHIPCLKITDGGIDALIIIYKVVMSQTQDYLTNCGELNLKVLNVFLYNLGLIEEDLIRGQERKKEISQQRRDRDGNQNHEKQVVNQEISILDSKKDILDKFKEQLKSKLSVINQQEIQTAQQLQLKGVEKKWSFLSIKQRYYQEKFGIRPNQFFEFIGKLKQSYIESLAWSLKYYYHGCVDWDWFYPYHYAPYAQDLMNVDQLVIEFSLNTPFQPFQQLLAVLPPASSHFLPQQFQSLMLDSHSPIADFYPSDFFVDLRGKKFAWLGEVVLPFIDADRLIQASTMPVHLSKIEQDRNRLGVLQLFLHNSKKDDIKLKISLEWSPRFPIGYDIKSPVPTMQNITNNQVITAVVKQTLLSPDPNFVQNAVLPSCIQPLLMLDEIYRKDCEYNKRSFGGEAVKRICYSILRIRSDDRRRNDNQQQDDIQKKVRV